jgi:cytochrome c biogenesis protein CcdA
MVDAVAVFQAFAAGVLSFFAPCSVAMLPAYISYYLGRTPGTAALAEGDAPLAAPRRRWEALALGLLGTLLVLAGLVDVFRVGSGESRLGPQQLGLVALGTALVVAGGLRAAPARARRGATLGLLTSAGILAVFGLLGLPFFGVLRVLDFQAQSLLVLTVAGAMVAMGLLGLAGRDLSFTLPIKAPQGRDRAAFLLFGVGYGLVALGCNLPLFLLAALGPIVRDADPLSGLLALLAYGAGMALLMVALSVGLAMGRGFTEQRLRTLIPKVKTAGHVVLVLAGLYIAWYDLTILNPGAFAF